MKTNFRLGSALLAAFTLFTSVPRAPAETPWTNALSLNGVDQYVRVDGIYLTNMPLTIELWAKRDGVGTWDGLLGQGQESSSNGLFFAFRDTNDVGFSFYSGGIYTINAYTDTDWHHWAATYDPGSGRRLFRDGVPIIADGQTNWYTGTGSVYIGSIPWNLDGAAFEGLIDEVRIWNVARTADEIRQSMGPLSGTEPNLVAYWKFDEGTDTIAYDATTNHFDGTLLNGATWTNSITFLHIDAGLPGLSSAACAWGDYNNDGWLDILLTGAAGSSPIAQVWRNTGVGFVNIDAGLPGVTASSAAWGDYNNDGRLDILLTGSTGSSRIAQVWRKLVTGAGFANINAGLPGVSAGSVAWGDYNNDGRLDILLTGYTGSGQIAQVWRNTGAGFANINAGLPGVTASSAAWGDYDNDGWLDILLTGTTGSGRIAQVWRNTGAGFVNINGGLPGIEWGSVAWGDYDNDGRPDILLTGDTGSGQIAQVWRNTGGSFTNINAGLPGVYDSSAVWGDYNNDGRLDVLLTGYTGSGQIAQVWRNTGAGFANINAGLPGVRSSSSVWGDYDSDGRLDILLAGYVVPGLIAQVWRNIGSTANSLPAPPSGLAVTVAGSAVNFNWNAATDAESPAAGLSYNLRVGTTPGGSDIASPHASPGGGRRVPALGNAQQRLSFQLTSPPLTNPVYWSVQAVDTAFAGSPFAPESSFTLWPVLGTESGVVPGDTNGDGIVNQAELDLVLSNYFPYSPWMYLTKLAGLGGTNVTFALPNSPAGAFSVLTSTNLADWEYLGPATPRYEFTDTNASAIPRRYYRLRWP